MSKNSITFFEKEKQEQEKKPLTTEEYWTNIWSGVIEEDTNKVIGNLNLLTEKVLEEEILQISRWEIRYTPESIKSFVANKVLDSGEKEKYGINILGIASLFLDSNSLEEYALNLKKNMIENDFFFGISRNVDYKILAYRALKEDNINLIKDFSLKDYYSHYSKEAYLEQLFLNAKDINYPKNCISFFIENNFFSCKDQNLSKTFTHFLFDHNDMDNIEKIFGNQNFKDKNIFQYKITENIMGSNLEKASQLEQKYQEFLAKGLIVELDTEPHIIIESLNTYLKYILEQKLNNNQTCSLENKEIQAFLENFGNYIKKNNYENLLYDEQKYINWEAVENIDKATGNSIVQSFIERQVILVNKTHNKKKAYAGL